MPEDEETTEESANALVRFRRLLEGVPFGGGVGRIMDAAARGVVGSYIGHEPGDDELVRQVNKVWPNFTSGVLRQLSERGAFAGRRDPWLISSKAFQSELESNPRLQQIYLREQEPLSLVPYIIEANPKRHRDWWEKGLDVVTDALGRPIGKGLEALAWPADQVELWIGKKILFNFVPDPMLRAAASKQTNEALFDFWHPGQYGIRMKQQLNRITASGVQGNEAVAAFEEWLKTPEGRTPVTAMVGGFLGTAVLDPFNLLFAGGIAGKAVTKGGKGVQALTRFLGPGGKAFRETTGLRGLAALRQINRIGEIAFHGDAIRLPPTGPTRWLLRDRPDYLASDAGRQILRIFSKPGGITEDELRPLAETLLAGKATPEFVAQVGRHVLENPSFARAVALASKNKFNLLDDVAEYGTRAEVLLSPADKAQALRDYVPQRLHDLVAAWQRSDINEPKFLSWWLPVVSAQKFAMSIFTLARPAFIPLNTANNFFTLAWHGMGHPADTIKFFRWSMGAEITGRYPEEFLGLAKAYMLDATTADAIFAGHSLAREATGSVPFWRKVHQLKTSEDAAEAVRFFEQSSRFPARGVRRPSFQAALTWPVSVAGGVDRGTRRAAGMMALKYQWHHAIAPREIARAWTPPIKAALIGEGVSPEVATKAERQFISNLSVAAQRGEAVFDPEVHGRILRDTVAEYLTPKPTTGLSGDNIGYLWAKASFGKEGPEAHRFLQDFRSELDEITDILNRAGDFKTPKHMQAALDDIAQRVNTADVVFERMTNTRPIMREGTAYQKGFSATEENLRAAVIEPVEHLSKLLQQSAVGRFGLAERQKFLEAADGIAREWVEAMAEVNATRIRYIAEGRPLTEMRAVWPAYRQAFAEKGENFYQVTRGLIAKRNTTAAKKVDAWYDSFKAFHERKLAIIEDALREGTDEAWEAAGRASRELVAEQSRLMGSKEIFGWGPKPPAWAEGYVRPSAPVAMAVDNLVTFAKTRIADHLAGAAVERAGPLIGRSAADAVLKLSKELTANANAVRQQTIGQAMAHADMVMLNYNKQFGLDSIGQMFFPYLYFPTRTVAHWGIRMARAPGGAAFLAKALLQPQQYAQQYGLPERLQFQIPIPIPFLGEFLRHMPGVNKLISTEGWGPIYWTDPMALLFPLTYYRDNFEDERRRGTPLGLVLDTVENIMPAGLSPFAKIIGSEAGFLDKDAWSYGVFRGGPFGVSGTLVGRAATLWLQNGDDLGMLSDEDKDNYVDKGSFLTDTLRRITGIAPDQWGDYRAERALAGLLATDQLVPGRSHEEQARLADIALYTHKGPAWKKAVRQSLSDQFLADLTGWAFARIVPAQEGELRIRMGLRSLYREAVKNGKQEEFFDKYPEYSLYQRAVRGIDDPEGQHQASETTLYYEAVEQWAEAPYRNAIDELNGYLDDLSRIEQTEPVRNQISVIRSQLEAVRNEQSAVYDLLEKAFPDREQELSLNRDPRDRTLTSIERLYYDLPNLLSSGPELTEEDEKALQGALLQAMVSGAPNAIAASFLLAGKATHPDEVDARAEYDVMLGAIQTGRGRTAAVQIAKSHRQAHQNALRPEVQGTDRDPYPGQPEKNQEAVDGFTQVIQALQAGPQIVPEWERIKKTWVAAQAAQDVPQDKIEAAREVLLRQFPPQDETHSEDDWHDLTVASIQTKLGYGIRISAAYGDGDSEKAQTLLDERDAALRAIHTQADARVTRLDVEMFISRNQRGKTPEEQTFEEAEALFDLWMSLVGDGSPLSNRQQGAVSGYFRQHPLIQKYYQTSAMDVKNMSVRQVADLLRRREIWRTYYDIDNAASQIDYIRSVADELNDINARMGLPPLRIIDPPDSPPDPPGGTLEMGLLDFAGQGLIQEIRERARRDGLSEEQVEALIEELVAEEGGPMLTDSEVQRIVEAVLQRGY